MVIITEYLELSKLKSQVKLINITDSIIKEIK